MTNVLDSIGYIKLRHVFTHLLSVRYSREALNSDVIAKITEDAITIISDARAKCVKNIDYHDLVVIIDAFDF